MHDYLSCLTILVSPNATKVQVCSCGDKRSAAQLCLNFSSSRIIRLIDVHLSLRRLTRDAIAIESVSGWHCRHCSEAPAPSPLPVRASTRLPCTQTGVLITGSDWNLQFRRARAPAAAALIQHGVGIASGQATFRQWTQSWQFQAATARACQACRQRSRSPWTRRVCQVSITLQYLLTYPTYRY